MTQETIHILHVEDSEDDHALVRREIEKAGIDAEWKLVDDADDFQFTLNLSQTWGWDVVLCDHSLPEFSSEEALKILNREKLDIPFLIVSGAIGEVEVVEAMKAGAHDFVSKSGLFRLAPAMLRAIREAQVRQEKRRAEESLRQTSERLKGVVETLTRTQNHLSKAERLRALGYIASGIEHNLNNNLSKIDGVAELLLERCPEERESLELLQAVVEDTASIAAKIREFRRESNTGPQAVLNVNEVIAEAISMTEPRWKTESEIRNRPIRIETRLEAKNGILADSVQLREAIANLILNSCDAMPEGGIIRISTADDGSYVVTRVEDNGRGMSEETFRRCREPFFTTKGDNHVGAGLGLADAVVRQLGGSIRIQSKEEEGTAVRIQVPAEMAVSQFEDGASELAVLSATEIPESPVDGGCGMRILLVDDDESIITIFSQLLESEGHTVIAVDNGREAIEKVSHAPFDLVITDLAMPAMNGEELSVELKRLHPELPVILTTGVGEGNELLGSIEEMVDYMLPKPINRRRLREAIQATVPLSRPA